MDGMDGMQESDPTGNRWTISQGPLRTTLHPWIVHRERPTWQLSRMLVEEVYGELVRADCGIYAILDRAARQFTIGRLGVAEGDTFVLLPGGRPILECYANSERHLLPVAHPLPVGELLGHGAREAR